jgi:hypothetical protein
VRSASAKGSASHKGLTLLNRVTAQGGYPAEDSQLSVQGNLLVQVIAGKSHSARSVQGGDQGTFDF